MNMKKHSLAVLFLALLTLAVGAATCAATTRMIEPDQPEPLTPPTGGWPPPFVTSWQGTEYTIPFGADKSGQEVLAWALAMPAVQSAMAEAQAHGAVRRSDADAAYSMSGYACAVIAFEFPGTSINDVQPIICVCTKMLDDGRATTNIFGGSYGKTVVNGVEVPQMRDDVPGAFQIAVAWTEGTQQNQQTPGTLAVEGELGDAFAVWWEISRENTRYWTNAVLTDRSVAASFINQVLIAAGGGTLSGAIAGLGGGPGGGRSGCGGIRNVCCNCCGTCVSEPTRSPPTSDDAH